MKLAVKIALLSVALFVLGVGVVATLIIVRTSRVQIDAARDSIALLAEVVSDELGVHVNFQNEDKILEVLESVQSRLADAQFVAVSSADLFIGINSDQALAYLSDDIVDETVTRVDGGNVVASSAIKFQEDVIAEVWLADSLDSQYRVIRRTVLFSAIILVVVTAAAVGATFVVIRFTTKPIMGSLTIVSDHYEKGDLVPRLEVRTKDEIAQFAESVNTFVDRFSLMIAQVKGTVGRSAQISERLSTIAKKTTDSTKGIHDRIQVNGTDMEALAKQIEDVSDRITRIGTVVEELRNFADEQAGAVSQSSSSIEEISRRLPA